jgi:coproporphyrinogen III oxidase
LAHRKEHRGIGGIFFDDLDDKLPATLMRLVRDVGLAFIEAYFPVVQRRKDTSFGERERQWQELRHGRYVEFNLLYDRGTKFGLATPDANIENILVSLPLTVRYEYMHVPPAGSDEARALEVLRNPRDWLAAK